ncbi:hypothetical protein AB6806_20090 [Bosea sp. RCC_152_1]|uniref:hypothetical protein n=1 Tax=Bosea sp. RCC_152_1 TaxID=3239228 RepID=UPI0035254257
MSKIRTYDDLARALKRFEELFGAPVGTAEAIEFREISISLRSFEDQVAARIAARKLAIDTPLDSLPLAAPAEAF